MPVVNGEYVAPELESAQEIEVKEEPQPVVSPKEPDPSPLHQTLIETLKQINAKTDTSLANAALVADPNIRAYLEAKAQGKQVQLAEVKPVETPQPEVPADVENMSNADFSKFIIKSIQQSLEPILKNAVSSEIAAVRNELGSKINDVLALEGNRMRETAEQQIQKVKEAHSDFDSIRPQMAELAKSTQGLSAEELYHLAKLRMGVPAISQTQISSERPGMVPGSPTPRSAIKIPNKSGTSGFKEMLAAALASRTA